MFEEYYNILNKAFENNGLSELLSEDKVEKLYRLSHLLIETNKVVNLTAITDIKGIILKHFLDCATICVHIPQNATVIDIGCGAGFPTLPLAILREDLRITALDSTGKKISFVKAACKELYLTNVTPICARAEEFVTNNREKFDVCTSRAVARLNVLSELCLPFVKVGGSFLAMKAGKGIEEHTEATKGIEILGGICANSYSHKLSFDGEEIEREIYAYSKSKRTPPQYPRKYAQILKKPL